MTLSELMRRKSLESCHNQSNEFLFSTFISIFISSSWDCKEWQLWDNCDFRTVSIDDNAMLYSYLPLLREFLPTAAEEIESDISSVQGKESCDPALIFEWEIISNKWVFYHISWVIIQFFEQKITSMICMLWMTKPMKMSKTLSLATLCKNSAALAVLHLW